MAEAELSASLFTILAGLVEERTGIHYERRDNAIFSSKLLGRAVDAGFESALDYYYFLRYDDHDRCEFDALVETLVVNETFFFREPEPLHVLCNDVQTAATNGRRVRVWCAAAATGEEPLTFAMMLADRQLLEAVHIVASDISDRALARAREGVYSARAFRSTPEDVRARWFRELGDGRASVASQLREAIEWRRVNLQDGAAVRELGTFDIVLCRNVLIYFSEGTVRDVVNRVSSTLCGDGRLLVGASESLMRFGTALVCEERSGAFFYRRPTS